MKSILLIVGVIGLVALAAAAGFWGGMAYKTNQTNNVRATFFEQRGQPPEGGQFPEGMPIPGGGQDQGFFRGGGTMGEVKGIDGNVLTLSTPEDVTTVNLSDDTKIVKSVEGTTSDLQTGIRVMVVGERDDDGNIDASQITIINEDQFITRTAP